MSPEFKFGLITGIGICAWILAEHLLGLHTTHLEIGEYTRYFSMVIPVATLFLMLRQRQARAHHRLTMKAGLRSGLAASFLAALIVYSFMLAYHQWINPDWVDNALQLKVAALRDQGVDEIAIRQKITFYRGANSPRGMIATILLGLTVAGGIISLLLTLLLNSPPRPKPV